MSRKSEFENSYVKPAEKYLDWTSDKGCLRFYDKELDIDDKNVLVPLPFKFLVLMEFHTVKGWHDTSDSGIYANEVKNIGEEPLTVKAFKHKGGTLAKGIYRDIKEQLNNMGGHYCKSIYAMTEKGTIINISLKGSAVQAYGNFTDKKRSRLGDEWISIVSAEDHKKGKVKYTTPVFEFAKTLNQKQSDLADEAYEKLKSLLSTSSRKAEAADDIDADDIPSEKVDDF